MMKVTATQAAREIQDWLDRGRHYGSEDIALSTALDSRILTNTEDGQRPLTRGEIRAGLRHIERYDADKRQAYLRQEWQRQDAEADAQARRERQQQAQRQLASGSAAMRRMAGAL